jgi:RNA-directed DNA polymerase
MLKGMFRRLVKDRRLLGLMDLMVDSSNQQEPMAEYFPGDDLFTPHTRRRGLPIGNLTSQWFANWYLSGLDHHVTSHLGVGGYVRYCDDFVICHDDRGVLGEAADSVRKYLAGLRLRLHEKRTQVRATARGLTFVGYRLWATHRILRKTNVRAFRRRVGWMRRAYAARRIGWNDIKPRLASWIGHARQADSERLIRRLSGEWVFMRDSAERQPRAAWRVVEQQCDELPLGQPQQEQS